MFSFHSVESKVKQQESDQDHIGVIQRMEEAETEGEERKVCCGPEEEEG